MNAFEFMSKSPILTFFLAWFLADTVCRVYKLSMRHMNIRKHGWPPEHLDADGDLKEVKADD